MRRQQQDSRQYDLENIPIRTTPPVQYQQDQQFELVNGFPKQKAIDYRTTPEAFRRTVGDYNKSFKFVTDYFAPLVIFFSYAGLEGMLASGVTRSVVRNTAENTVKNGSTAATRLGQLMHKAYKAEDVLDGIRIKEFRLPSGKRIDFIDLENKIIYELKPNNARAIRQGIKQLQMYMKELQSMPRYEGIQWRTVLDTY